MIADGSDAPNIGEATRNRTTGLVELGDLAGLRAVDTVISVCPPEAALSVAREAVEAGFRGLYVDAVVVTDSGGIQEETTFFGIPCITLRENTERPVTIDVGTNILVGSDTDLVISEAKKVINGEAKKGRIPELWDGKAAERIVSIIEKSK